IGACGVIQTPEEIETPRDDEVETTTDSSIIEGESYDTAEEVAAYLEAFGELPVNYLTKEEARELGWNASDGNLWDIAPGASIGGDYFGNFEGLLPEDGDYREADIEYEGGYRNSQRLVYSEDGYYYY
ncbi:ribonuclease domain-containing protein, partial [Acinetobacter baumannii]|uniref:ribonuclease domain-containing protein n=1 Tax=Acinetobacter baumannii TaxID=470 RepID=UPI0018E07797